MPLYFCTWWPGVQMLFLIQCIYKTKNNFFFEALYILQKKKYVLKKYIYYNTQKIVYISNHQQKSLAVITLTMLDSKT